MSEIEYTIRRFKEGEFTEAVRFTESELYRRIYLAFRAAFCTLTEEFDYAKAVEILVNGEGENQHDLPGCEDEAGPNWKGEQEKGEVNR